MIYGYIYKLTSADNRVYIGQTTNVEKRWKIHQKKAKNNCIHYISRAINKYGWDNFKKEIIDITYSRKELDELEIKYIKLYNSQNKANGFNIASGGKTWNPSCWDDETKKKAAEKRRQKMSGINNPSSLVSLSKKYNCSIEEARKHTSMYGKHRDEYTKKRVSETHKNKYVSEKTKEKMRQNQLIYTYLIENMSTKEKFEIKNLYE